MRNLRFIFSIIGLFLSISCWAQDSLRVTFIERPNTAITNQQNKRRDRNGNLCAMVEVSARNIQNYRFSSSVIVGDVEYDAANNAAKFFVVPDFQSTSISILSSDYPTQRIRTGALQGLHIYDMSISVVRDKMRTLLMPVVGVGGINNYGVMLAFVKKVGPYFKASSNFESTNPTTECNDDGKVSGNANDYAFFSGQSKQHRMSFTAGAIIRLWQANLASDTQALYMFAGGGYGAANLLWETTDNEWLKNSDHSHQGIEVEGGVVYRFKALSLMAGVQTNSFAYSEASIGIGVMF